MAVRYGLAEFNTGDHILDLPVLPGASWSTMLNNSDELSCTVDLRDRDVKALDIPSSTEPKKTVLFAQSMRSGAILAWGVISDREWDDDARRLALNASGGGQYFANRIIAPPAAATGDLVDAEGKVVSDYDTTINDVSLGTIGKKLVEQALAWPGAPTAFVLPPDVADPGRTSGTYRLVNYKSVKAALDDLSNRADGGPDFAFDGRTANGGLSLEYVMRIGEPLLGEYVGSWASGAPDSPISGLKAKDDGSQLATHIWMQAGRTDSKVIVARVINQSMLDLAGYPVLDLVDTSHTDVTLQTTLDDYANENALMSSRLYREIGFSVRGTPRDADGNAIGPALGEYRPGDWVGVDVGPGNLYLAEGRITVRVTSISGDETGENVQIGCDVGIGA